MARILFDSVAKRFGDVSVIEDLELEIKDEEFMVFVGPSGCGKSTALRMIAGLEEVTEGTLHIGDRVVNDVHPKDRDVAMVFQSYALYPHMSVRDNISFGLRIRKMAQAEIDKAVSRALETDPGKRFATAEEFREALLAGLPTPGARKRLLAVAGVALVVVVAAVHLEPI